MKLTLLREPMGIDKAVRCQNREEQWRIVAEKTVEIDGDTLVLLHDLRREESEVVSRHVVHEGDVEASSNEKRYPIEDSDRQLDRIIEKVEREGWSIVGRQFSVRQLIDGLNSATWKPAGEDYILDLTVREEVSPIRRSEIRGGSLVEVRSGYAGPDRCQIVIGRTGSVYAIVRRFDAETYNRALDKGPATRIVSTADKNKSTDSRELVSPFLVAFVKI